MLDLDAIANARAADLNQERKAWREAVWSPPFQKLSARVTDGEVLELLALCASAPELEALTHLLTSRATDPQVTPLDWLRGEAARAGLAPVDWVKRFARPGAR